MGSALRRPYKTAYEKTNGADCSAPLFIFLALRVSLLQMVHMHRAGVG